MEEIKYSMDVEFRTNDFDSTDFITPTAILSLFQDIAGLHAFNLGIGYEALLEKGFYWVLVRNRFDIFKNPIPLTKGRLITWPHEKGRVDFNREYVLYDEDNEVVARGISKWVLIDTVNRRIARTSNITYGEGVHVKENFYQDVLKLKIPTIDNFRLKGHHIVMKSDLDHNNHMNNSKYTDIIFNVCSDNIKIKKFNIDYIKETTLGDVIDIYEYIDDNFIYHLGRKNDENIFISRIEKEM